MQWKDPPSVSARLVSLEVVPDTDDLSLAWQEDEDGAVANVRLQPLVGVHPLQQGAAQPDLERGQRMMPSLPW